MCSRGKYDANILAISEFLRVFFVSISSHISHFPGHRMGYADYQEMNTSSLQNVSLFSVERNSRMFLMICWLSSLLTVLFSRRW